ncbi:hypothetical protein HOP50_07g50040 [Chloropicon primus]|uniref:Uncharacterized protein n=1 Tax=Chloropicon primus TaxID=1764295 RepID=A0A5B8MPW9_9CHLO|nr:hypothetical protein A3770_07p49810 [Chloropicon primus]UPR01682.1 hypothetical protein HOP50_07g50040 [Chloropicon primus]|eukprot:QDZ22463.1 hypothetical protein A3770_07p49810 [Chloropicon primus]
MEGPKGGTEARQYTSRELAVRLESMYSRGIFLGLAQVLAPAAIPAYDYLEAYSKDDRLYPYTFVFIGANVLVGVLGILASTQRRSSLLALHVATAVIVGCIVGGLSLLLSHLMWVQCELKAKSFDGCNELLCSCLADDTCTTSDFDNNIGCSECKAYPNDICSYFDYDSVARGFNPETYKVLVIVCMNVLSATHSMLALIRKEHFDSIQSSRRELIVEHLKAQELGNSVVPPPGGGGGKPAGKPAGKQPPLGNSNAPPPQADQAAKRQPPPAQKKKKERRKKAKSKKISPVTSFEEPPPEAEAAPTPAPGAIFDLGKSKTATEKDAAKMMDQTEYDRLRQSVQQQPEEAVVPKKKDASKKAKKPPKVETAAVVAAPAPKVETDLGLEDVDDFLDNLL